MQQIWHKPQTANMYHYMTQFTTNSQNTGKECNDDHQMSKIVNLWVEFNVPLDTLQVISGTSVSSQSFGYCTEKSNLQHPR